MSKNILITGASTGFGRGMAERLARRGDRVFATMRDVKGRNAGNREALEGLATAENLQLQVIELDVTDQASVDNAVAAALAAERHLDVVVNNAAIAAPEASEGEEVVAEVLRLIDMPASERPFRTPVSAMVQQLLGSYNAGAEALRPIVAQIFNVPELAGTPAASSVAP